MKRILYICLMLVYSLYGQIPNLQFPLDTLAMDDHFNYRSYADFDQNGFLHIVNTRQYDTNSATREIMYHTNKNGEFETTALTSNSVDDNYATLDFDHEGFVHVGYESRDAANLFQVMYVNNRGGQFADSVWITTGGKNKATPYMAVTSDSTAHFVYLTFETGTDYAYYRSYNYISGIKSSEIQLGIMEASSENDISIDTDSNDHIHIIFRDNGLGNGHLRYFTNSGGSLAEVSTGVTDYIEYPMIHVDKNDVVHILYRLLSDKRLYTINNKSGSFNQPVAVTPINSGRPSYYRKFTSDDAGRIYITWQNGTSTGDKGFFLAHGKDNVFSDPVLIFEDSTGAYSIRGATAASARLDGELAIVFSASGIRNSLVISDIYLKSGNLFGIGPDISVHPDSLAFGSIPVGTNDSLILKIQNNGTSVLELDSIVSGDAVFTVGSFAASIQPDSFQNVTIYFEPSAVSEYQSMISIYGDNAAIPLANVPVSGFGDFPSTREQNYQVPSGFKVSSVYPNPFNPDAAILFSVPAKSEVRMEIVNIAGELIKSESISISSAGNYTYRINGKSWASGTYFIRLSTEKYPPIEKKFILVK